jgi:peptide/nickel transport system substrate-binding protein
VEPGYVPLKLHFVKDENTRALLLARGQADALQNGLSLAKVRWLEREHSSRYQVLERDGVNVAYLAFNLRDSDLSKLAVRKAIALAIDRKAVVRERLSRFVSISGSFLSPLLPESAPQEYAHDPAQAIRLLEDAGYKAGPDGVRLRLRYKTTPVRDGYEMALIFKEQLARVGIQLELDVVEAGVFLASLRKGAFQLCSSRWLGVSDGSILFRTLRSGQPNNRVGYASAETDRLLDLAIQELDSSRRAQLMAQVQARMAADLPYLPLWHWTNALILRKDLARNRDGSGLGLTGALEPLARLLAEPPGIAR